MAQRHFFMTLKRKTLLTQSFHRHKKMTPPSLFYDAQGSAGLMNQTAVIYNRINIHFFFVSLCVTSWLKLEVLFFLQLTFTFWC